MEIDYVVFSSDDNENYLPFYEPVAQIWKERIGLKSIFVHVTDEDIKHDFEQIENEYGLYIKVKKRDSCPSSLQAQIVRLFISVLFKDKNLLLSDVDMIPIDKEFFVGRASLIKENALYVYTGQPYCDVPYFPFCYILGKGSTIVDIINQGHYDIYIDTLFKQYTGDWNTDEHYFYDKVMAYSQPEKILKGRRDFSSEKRIDKIDTFDVNRNLNGYVDCHSLRPYSRYKEKLDHLIKRLLSEK